MASQIHYIGPDELDFEKIRRILFGGMKLGISETASRLVVRCREYLDRKLEKTREPLYGINTGFGSLHDRLISKSHPM